MWKIHKILIIFEKWTIGLGLHISYNNPCIILSFYELLEGVAQICERECGLLPPNVSPDCAIQLTYVSQVSQNFAPANMCLTG